MPTIDGLVDGSTPLAGTERVPIWQAADAHDVPVSAFKEYIETTRPQMTLAPTGAVGETSPRVGSLFSSMSASNLITGRLHLSAIWLPKSVLCTSITYVSGAAGATAPTNQWFALLDSSRVFLRSTSNDGTTAWGADAAKTLNLSSTFTTTYAGLYYVGIMVTVTTTMPTMTGILNTTTGVDVLSLAPIANGFSSTGLTTPPSDGTTAAAITAHLAAPYACVK